MSVMWSLQVVGYMGVPYESTDMTSHPQARSPLHLVWGLHAHVYASSPACSCLCTAPCPSTCTSSSAEAANSSCCPCTVCDGAQ